MENTARAHPQSGNMLVYILGAIFLLGILIIAAKGNIQPGASIDSEAVTIKVSQVRKYASELERGVQYAMRNGISETDLRFSHASAVSTYGTPGTNPKAEVFHPNGGGVEWKDPPAGIQVTTTPWNFNGVNDVYQVGSNCEAASCTDLIALLPNVTKSFCLALNNSVGVTNPSGNPPKEDSNIKTDSVFNSSAGFTWITNVRVTGYYTDGRPEACLEGNTGAASTGLTGSYYYYKVLMAR